MFLAVVSMVILQLRLVMVMIQVILAITGMVIQLHLAMVMIRVMLKVMVILQVILAVAIMAIQLHMVTAMIRVMLEVMAIQLLLVMVMIQVMLAVTVMVIQLHLAQNTTCMEDVVELIYNGVIYSSNTLGSTTKQPTVPDPSQKKSGVGGSSGLRCTVVPH